MTAGVTHLCVCAVYGSPSAASAPCFLDLVDTLYIMVQWEAHCQLQSKRLIKPIRAFSAGTHLERDRRGFHNIWCSERGKGGRRRGGRVKRKCESNLVSLAWRFRSTERLFFFFSLYRSVSGQLAVGACPVQSWACSQL